MRLMRQADANEHDDLVTVIAADRLTENEGRRVVAEAHKHLAAADAQVGGIDGGGSGGSHCWKRKDCFRMKAGF